MAFGPTMPPGSVFAAPSDPSVLRPVDASGWKPGMAMAGAVHLLLVLALAMGVQWKSHPPAAVEAEVWTEVPRIEAPSPVAPTPAEVTPPQPAPPPVPVEAEAPVEPKMDVAMIPVKPKVDKRKPNKVEKAQTKKPPKEEFILDPPKKALPKTPAKPDKVVTPPKPVLDPKVAAKAAAKAEAEAQAKTKAEAELLAAQRRANLDKLMKNLAQDQISAAGPSEAYAGRIAALIRRNVVFTGVVPPTARLEVLIKLSSKGKIIDRTVTKKSGFPDFDDAVLRGIDKAEQVPPDENGRFQPEVLLVYMRESF